MSYKNILWEYLLPIDSSFFLVDHVKVWSARKRLMKRVHKWFKASGGKKHYYGFCRNSIRLVRVSNFI